jgi:hypothetical protein
MTYDNTLGSANLCIYLNGTLDNSGNYTDAISGDAYKVYIGGYAEPPDFATGEKRSFDGKVDEARFSIIDRGANWIKATYLTTSGAFITYGSEEET